MFDWILKISRWSLAPFLSFLLAYSSFSPRPSRFAKRLGFTNSSLYRIWCNPSKNALLSFQVFTYYSSISFFLECVDGRRSWPFWRSLFKLFVRLTLAMMGRGMLQLWSKTYVMYGGYPAGLWLLLLTSFSSTDVEWDTFAMLSWMFFFRVTTSLTSF